MVLLKKKIFLSGLGAEILDRNPMNPVGPVAEMLQPWPGIPPISCVSQLGNLQICCFKLVHLVGTPKQRTLKGPRIFVDAPQPSTISRRRFSGHHGHHAMRTESEDLRRWCPRR